ncbi:DUF4352 domain-containing protein [Romboutsia weinsteinii]|uniref:DUF4352 domain-containing protein n=1 Tax=Romboutsia weinsteinii TaxID=2020949 RepID=A0A371J2X1_9FIRM|nr:DUF4352 domain-containing protein [Romboutsia weinsteinii]RDY27006.1 DUF4352 domain-containing protein [Romboutsia weinsteinii]
MYKNYKIGSDGTPKYNGGNYRIAPERRFTKNTPEWERRLRSDTLKLHRRRTKKQENVFTLKVKHVLYAFVVIIFISVIGKFDTNIISKTESVKYVDMALDSAFTDVGNHIIKPSEGNMFLHINLSLENKLNSTNKININEFILTDENNNKYNVFYLNNAKNIETIDLESNSKIVDTITFEMPINYRGELELLFENDNDYNRTITKFNIK